MRDFKNWNVAFGIKPMDNHDCDCSGKNKLSAKVVKNAFIIVDNNTAHYEFGVPSANAIYCGRALIKEPVGYRIYEIYRMPYCPTYDELVDKLSRFVPIISDMDIMGE